MGAKQVICRRNPEEPFHANGRIQKLEEFNDQGQVLFVPEKREGLLQEFPCQRRVAHHMKVMNF